MGPVVRAFGTLRIAIGCPSDDKRYPTAEQFTSVQGLSTASIHNRFFTPELRSGVSFTIFPFPRSISAIDDFFGIFPPEYADYMEFRSRDGKLDIHCVDRSSALDYFFYMQQMSRPLMLDGTVLEVENITCHGYGVLRSYSRVLADSPLSLDSFCTLLSEAGLPVRTLLYVEHTEDRYFEIATPDRLLSILIHTFLKRHEILSCIDTPLAARVSSKTVLADLPPSIPPLDFLRRSTEMMSRPMGAGSGKRAMKRKRLES
jgi:hypothetical protein